MGTAWFIPRLAVHFSAKLGSESGNVFQDPAAGSLVWSDPLSFFKKRVHVLVQTHDAVARVAGCTNGQIEHVTVHVHG
jgi:hypothetical protein